MGARRAAADRPLEKAEYEMLAAFRYALRQFLRFSEEAAASVGLTPQQHQALLAVKGYPGRDYVTNGELAEQLQIRHHSAVGLINRLEAQGLLERSWEHGDDRRKVYVRLTGRGAKLLERLTAAQQEELRRNVPQLQSRIGRLNK